MVIILGVRNGRWLDYPVVAQKRPFFINISVVELELTQLGVKLF